MTADPPDATARQTGDRNSGPPAATDPPDPDSAHQVALGDAEARTAPGRGRQAEAARNDRRILDAARRVFARSGADAPVSAIAAEAGVGMGSLYRRFASKDDLLRHLCQMAMEQSIEAAETALASPGDAWSALAGYVRACVAFRSGAFAPAAGTFPVTEQMVATAARSYELIERLVSRAHAEGALRPDVTGVDLVELIGLFSRSARWRPTDDGYDPDHVEQRLLGIALDGLRAPGRERLAEPAPRWQEYSALWGPPA
jgi:AcrR family transcriptional regulator